MGGVAKHMFLYLRGGDCFCILGGGAKARQAGSALCKFL